MTHRTYSPIRDGISKAWDCYLVRVAVLAAALGAVPFYFLSLAVAALGS